MSDMRIDYISISEILKWPRNPKKHDEKNMDASIERFGFADPLTIDESTGHLVEGHGRIEALERRRKRGAVPPLRIRVADGGAWLVPVVRGVSFANALEAEAYVVAHNRVGEGLWDNAALAEILAAQKEISLDGLGFDDGEVEKILAKHNPDPANIEFDEYDESDAAGVIVHECPKCGHKFASGKK